MSAVAVLLALNAYIFKVATFRPMPRPEGRRDGGDRGGAERRPRKFRKPRERGEGERERVLGLSPLRKRGEREGG